LARSRRRSGGDPAGSEAGGHPDRDRGDVQGADARLPPRSSDEALGGQVHDPRAAPGAVQRGRARGRCRRLRQGQGLDVRRRSSARSMSKFREIAADALKYWELRRPIYNLVLFGVVAVEYFARLPESKTVLTTDNLIGCFILAVLANVAYCAAYAVDIFVQVSGVQASCPQRCWIVLLVGTAFAGAVTHFFAQGFIAASGPVPPKIHGRTPPPPEL